MKDRDTGPAGNSARIAREKRLAEALRSNLRRRKTAGRTAESAAGAESGAPATQNPPDSAKRDG